MFYTSLGWFNGFNPDSWVMYLMYALIVVFISAEAIFYLVKSVKKAKQIGMDMTKIKKVIKTSASFSVLPAIGIGIGVVTLIGSLGITVPAIRLSVIGALQYETQMADGAAKAITGSTDGLTLLIQRGVTAQDYATIVTLMTVAIIAGPVLVVLFYKKLQPKLAKLGAMKVGGRSRYGDEKPGKRREKGKPQRHQPWRLGVPSVLHRYDYRLHCNVHRRNCSNARSHHELLQLHCGYRGGIVYGPFRFPC